MTSFKTTIGAAIAIAALTTPAHAQVTYTDEQAEQAKYWMQPDQLCGQLGQDTSLDDLTKLHGCEALLAGMDAEFLDPAKMPKSQFVKNFYWMSRSGLLGAIALHSSRVDGGLTRRVCVAHLDGRSAEAKIILDAWPQELREIRAIDTATADKLSARCLADFPALG